MEFNPHKLLREIFMSEHRCRLHEFPSGFALEVSPAIPSDLVERLQRSWKEGCDKRLEFITGFEVIGCDRPPLSISVIPYSRPVW